MSTKRGNLLTCKEAADLLGVSARRVRRFALDKRLKGTQIARTWVFTRQAVEAFAQVVRLPGAAGRPGKILA